MLLFLQPSIVHDQTLQIPKNVHNLPFFSEYVYVYRDIMYNIKTVTYSNTCELGWWIVAMIVLPFPAMSLLIFGTRIIHSSKRYIVTNVCSYFYPFKAYRKTSMTFCAIKESRPDVGSSQNIKGGLVKTSAAKESRFISPPDIPLIVFWLLDEPTRVSKHLYKPSYNSTKLL